MTQDRHAPRAGSFHRALPGAGARLGGRTPGHYEPRAVTSAYGRGNDPPERDHAARRRGSPRGRSAHRWTSFRRRVHVRSKPRPAGGHGRTGSSSARGESALVDMPRETRIPPRARDVPSGGTERLTNLQGHVTGKRAASGGRIACGICGPRLPPAPARRLPPQCTISRRSSKSWLSIPALFLLTTP